jgi:hypothetical protein
MSGFHCIFSTPSSLALLRDIPHDFTNSHQKAASLRYNSPHALSLSEARRLGESDQLESARERDRIFEAGMSCVESGRDGHK